MIDNLQNSMPTIENSNIAPNKVPIELGISVYWRSAMIPHRLKVPIGS